ncbi:uncharacterized protein LOC130965663 [Arachis stenosperma]|uniref:uncharacterized protein LOC130965663 n=1 Tax=Arachis stenosperma TaxID=217475 RepID=UPI0025AB88D9|nr:uncharacterized protein LOC130965663 [Arachis stenosperma]
MSGNNIDVYLELLVDELKPLCDGVETYDANKGTNFKMHAALMWTISNFLGLRNLFGWNTYSGFDGQVESRDPPKKYYGTDVLRQQCNIQVSLLKNSTLTAKRRRIGEDADQDDSYWKKRSVFFELLYWKDHILRHNLDVMHIEKNICDNMVFTILNDSVKSKDNLKARKDLQSMGIRPKLWPDEGGKYPSAIFTMSNPHKNMEIIFLPSFFTVMVHFTVHLVDELKLGGLVHYRQMYPIEKYLGRLKQHVHNRAQAEGSIAEGYLFEEILTFCSRYFDNIETKINRPAQVDDQPVDITNNTGSTMFPEIGKVSGAVSHFVLTPMERDQAHRHVLVNCEAVAPFIDTFRVETKRKLWDQTRSQSKIDRVVHAEFSRWFKREVRRFGAYNVNEYKFRTITKEDGLKTQNSGVYVSSNTRSYASMRNNRVTVGSVPYYGKIVDIIELNYSCHFTVVLFRCIWVDTTTSRGMKQDHLGLTSVNFTRPIHTGDREEDEPYILASESHLVYYVRDEVDQEWSVVVHVKP